MSANGETAASSPAQRSGIELRRNRCIPFACGEGEISRVRSAFVRSATADRPFTRTRRLILLCLTFTCLLCLTQADAQENAEASPAPAAQVSPAAPTAIINIPGIPSPSATPATLHAPAPYSIGSGSSGGSLQLLVYFFLLLGVLAAAAFFFRGGFAMLRVSPKGDKRKLHVAETRNLGNRQFLIVAEYEDRKMLIGVCPGRIDYLCSLAGRDETFSAMLPEKAE